MVEAGSSLIVHLPCSPHLYLTLHSLLRHGKASKKNWNASRKNWNDSRKNCKHSNEPDMHGPKNGVAAAAVMLMWQKDRAAPRSVLLPSACERCPDK